jgi:hypothetical protein
MPGALSHWSELNRRPLDYESSALPLSYSGTLDVPTHRDLQRIRCKPTFSGAEGSRTPYLCSAIAALSQLSYSPDRITCAVSSAFS